MLGLARYVVHGAGGGGNAPSLNFNFVDGSAFPSAITFSRASSATMFDSSGNLVYAPMNAIRNNTMVGAVAGTPGTLPTNWSTFFAPTGITRTVVGVGVSNGITYIDVRLSGTASGAGELSIYPEAAGILLFAAGTVLSQSVWLAVAGGSTSNISSVRLRSISYSGASYLSEADIVPAVTSTLTRFSLNNYTLAPTADRLAVVYSVFVAAAGAIDITLRIGMPQLELGSVAREVIATSGTAYQGPRLDYDPATLLARGLLIEEQRTNSIRNNTMQGAVAGTPGTVPTNWQSVIVAGLATTVVGTGVQNGITYLDLRVNGTPTASSFYNLVPDILIAGSSGQTWTGSFWASLIAGSLTNTNANIEIRESDAAQGFLTNTLTALPITSTLTRYSQARILTNASTAFVSVRFVWQITSGLPVDFTLRIGLPQLEQGAFATSVIPTTTTALTRSADLASVNTLAPWYNASASTLYAEWTNIAATMPTGAAQVVTRIGDATGNNFISLFQIQGALSKVSQNMFSGGANPGRLDSGGAYSNATVKAAAAFAASDRALSANGTAATTSATGAMPLSATRMGLGIDDTFNGPLNGWLRRVTYYPRRLTDAALQQITA